MSTGNGNKGGGAAEVKAVGLRFERGRLVLELSDQREVSVPLSRYPTLQRARPAQRNDWVLIGPGKAFHWESLDLDLSVQGLVSGLPEVVPKPPISAELRRGKRRPTTRGAA